MRTARMLRIKMVRAGVEMPWVPASKKGGAYEFETENQMDRAASKSKRSGSFTSPM